MSDVAFNPAPAPELLNAVQGAGQGVGRARPDAPPPAGGKPAGAAPDPFAALLAGVLGTSAPAPALPAPEGAALPDAGLTTDATDPADWAPDPALLMALPGAATTTATPLADGSDGKLLPAGGKALPLPVPPAGDDAAPPPSGAKPAPVPAAAPRVFLADLALSRPVEPGVAAPSSPTPDPGPADLAAATPRSAPAVLAEGLAGVAGQSRGAAPPPSTASAPATTPAATAIATPAPLVAGGSERLALRLAGLNAALEQDSRGSGVPAADALASQLAAFAAGGEPATATLTTGTNPGGSATADSSALGLNGRAAGTLLLQPLAVTGDTRAFAGGLADRLVSLGGPGTHSARLKLHPEHLGELDVEITMDDGKAQVWFGAANSQARDAIQDSLPRLKELFADQGIQLTRTQVDTGGNPGGGFASAGGNDRRMADGAGAWSGAPAWRTDRALAMNAADPPRAMAASSRLLDVWA